MKTPIQFRLCCALDCAPHELPALLREAATFGAAAGAVLVLALLGMAA